jgi:NhaA family Na+:H+ antiporter
MPLKKLLKQVVCGYRWKITRIKFNNKELYMPRLSLLKQFLALEAASGLILLAAACIGLLVANSPLSLVYQHFIAYPLTGHLNLQSVINDGLMALFFLLIGLEIKRELLQGELATWSQRILPGIAAFAGMLVPALIYLVWHHSNPILSRGWAIPTATDIAFALGILSLLGRRVPVSLKLFLTALAILDDLGAVMVIALFYGQPLQIKFLLGALFLSVLLWLFNRLKLQKLSPYLLLAFPLWLCILKSGLHPTLAGVLLALAIPLQGNSSPLKKLEKLLHPWVAYLILPLFAFANSGLSLHGFSLAVLLQPLPLAIAIALFIGKPLGIFSSVWLSVKLGWAKLPENSNWLNFCGVTILCGIGFTMSLFIGNLAFADGHTHLLDLVKVGVLVGSIISGLCGYIVMRLTSKKITA